MWEHRAPVSESVRSGPAYIILVHILRVHQSVITSRIQLCPKIKQYLQSGGTKIDFGKLGDLPYANCYVCSKSGHLASYCPESNKGLYPHGGSCRECGSVDHFAADCPESKKKKQKSLSDEDDNDNASNASSNSVTIDQYLEEPVVAEEKAKEKKSTKKRKVVNF